MTDVKVFGAGFMDKTLMRGAVSIKNGALTRVRFLVYSVEKANVQPHKFLNSEQYLSNFSAIFG